MTQITKLTMRNLLSRALLFRPQASSRGRIAGNDVSARARHLRWVQRIVERVGYRGNQPYSRASSLLHARLDRNWFVLNQERRQLVQLMFQPVLHQHLARHVYPASQGQPSGRVPLVAHRRHPYDLPHKAQLTFRAAGHVDKKIGPQEAGIIVTASKRRAAVTPAGSAVSGAGVTPIWERIFAISARSNKRATVHVELTQDLVARRILQKVRREEQRSWPAALGAADARDAQLTQNRELLLARGQLPNWSKAEAQAPLRNEAQPVFNVTQLTDEVMKQLDRRLVAAQERMGRI